MIGRDEDAGKEEDSGDDREREVELEAEEDEGYACEAGGDELDDHAEGDAGFHRGLVLGCVDCEVARESGVDGGDGGNREVERDGEETNHEAQRVC